MTIAARPPAGPLTRKTIDLAICATVQPTAAAASAAVRAGVWLRPFRDLIYTMPPYVAGDDDVAAICAGVLAAVEAVGVR